MEDDDIKLDDIKPDTETYIFKKLDDDTETSGISFKRIDDVEAYKPVDRITPIKEKFALALDKLKELAHKAKLQAAKVKENLQRAQSGIKERIQSIPVKQKKLIGMSVIGAVVIVAALGISIKMYRQSDTYAYKQADSYVKAGEYEEAIEIYTRLIDTKGDLKTKEILAFLYLDKLQQPTLAEPLLREIMNLTDDAEIQSRLVDIFPVITVSPDSKEEKSYKELITVKLETAAAGAKILYRLENEDFSSDFIEYNGPIQLGDGKNTLYMKAISSVGFETEILSHQYAIDLDDKFVEFTNSALEDAIRKALNINSSNQKLRQSDLDKVESVQILGEDLWVNMPPVDFSEYRQNELTTFYGFEDFEKLSGLTQLRVINQDLGGGAYHIPALNNLESLEITHSKLTDITFLKSLPSVLHLDISNNEIESINGIQALEKLETLDLRNNRIRDVYHISNLVTLTSLDLINNPIEDTTVLKTLTNLENLAFTSTPNTAYEFMAQMKNLKSLDAGNYSSSKQYLSSEGRDISAIANLSQLESLSLEGAGIKNIDSLKNLKNITKLNLSYNELAASDIEVIGTLSNMEDLRIENIGSNLDISPLSSLSKIQYLNLSNNSGIENIESLANMKALSVLFAQRIGLQSLEALASLSKVEYLDISKNSLKEVDLSGYHSLIYFDGTGNEINVYPKTSITKSPEVMILKNNPIEDLANLESGIASLSYLDLSGTRIKDISIFSKANNLEILKLPSTNQLLNISVFDDMHSIKIVPINISERDLPTDFLDQYLK